MYVSIYFEFDKFFVFFSLTSFAYVKKKEKREKKEEEEKKK